MGGWIPQRRHGRRSGAARKRHAREARAGGGPGRAHNPAKEAGRLIAAAGAAVAVAGSRTAAEAVATPEDRREAARAISSMSRLAQGEAAPAAIAATKNQPPRESAPAVRSLGRISDDTLTHVSATVYRKDVIFKVSTPGFKRGPRSAERGAIKGFSADSAKRLKLLIRNTADLWTGFLTLTYPGDSFNYHPSDLNGPTIKKHINAFCQFLRRKKIAYVWILEFQERGAPHFHFLLSGFVDKTKVAKQWYSVVGSGDPRHLAAGTRVESVKNPDMVGAYMGSYMSKLDQKTVPAGFVRVGRFWGASRVLTKTLFRMKGLYRDVARELRLWRGQNKGIRRSVAQEQAAAAIDKIQEAANLMDSAEIRTVRVRKLLKAARGCEMRARGFSRRWTWKGDGFTLLRAAERFTSGISREGDFKNPSFGRWDAQLEAGASVVSIMRQAVALDSGRESADVWEPWDGKPDRRPVFVSPEERIRAMGQFLIGGGFEPAFSPVASKSKKNQEH